MYTCYSDVPLCVTNTPVCTIGHVHVYCTKNNTVLTIGTKKSYIIYFVGFQDINFVRL